MASVIASRLVPSPPEGLPPVQASGTSLPTIWRTISAAPSATFGECDTMTMPTLAILCVSQFIAERRDHQRRRSRAGIDVTDRSLAEKGSASARRPHRGRRFGRKRSSFLDSSEVAARRESLAARNENIEHGLLAGVALAARADRRNSRSERRSRVAARWLGREGLSQRQKQCAVQRPRRASHFHHELRADGLQE